jgi:hypothetical protein
LDHCSFLPIAPLEEETQEQDDYSHNPLFPTLL